MKVSQKKNSNDDLPGLGEYFTFKKEPGLVPQAYNPS